MRDDDQLGGWPAVVNRIVRGDRPSQPRVVLGPTPSILLELGLNSGALTMSAEKLARCRREHSEVALDVWHRLPQLIANPLAVFPSYKRDGSVVLLLLEIDRDGNPVVAAVIPDSGPLNVVLSVYGKQDGLAWAQKEIARAIADQLPVFEGKDFAASLPQPPAVETASSSRGLIPVDGTTKSKREILHLPKESSKS
ncbi:MAG: hypothetical protein ABL912_09710 [Novosphingobium sp.]